MERGERSRLDAALADRGLAPSRTAAARLVRDGRVHVNGAVAQKPSEPVDDDTELVVDDAGWVSRGALKLDAALEAFAVSVSGRLALDAGASTGGFTQVLLRRGCEKVLAVDVGHDQLSPVLADDPRVVSVEGMNVRTLDRATLTAATGESRPPDVVVADLSFISLRQVLPALVSTAADDADFVLLIKPQFEVGRTGVRAGVVRDPALRASAARDVLAAAWGLGIGTAGLIPSPIVGAAGNHESLVHLSASAGSDPAEWTSALQDLTRTALID